MPYATQGGFFRLFYTVLKTLCASCMNLEVYDGEPPSTRRKYARYRLLYILDPGTVINAPKLSRRRHQNCMWWIWASITQGLSSYHSSTLHLCTLSISWFCCLWLWRSPQGAGDIRIYPRHYARNGRSEYIETIRLHLPSQPSFHHNSYRQS